MDYITAGDIPRLRYPQFEPRAPPDDSDDDSSDDNQPELAQLLQTAAPLLIGLGSPCRFDPGSTVVVDVAVGTPIPATATPPLPSLRLLLLPMTTIMGILFKAVVAVVVVVIVIIIVIIPTCQAVC